MGNKISFIYFDIGGVMIKDFSSTSKWKELTDELGIPDNKQNEFNEAFEVFEKETNLGRNTEEFLPILRNKFGIKMPSGYSFLMAFVDRFSRNEGMEKILNGLKNKYNFGLLTNMYAGMFGAIKAKHLLPNVKWEVVVDSSIVKCKKPEGEIYGISQKMAKTKAEEILFVDNKKKNLVIPKQMGWQTYWYDTRDYEKSSEELRLLLK